MRTLDCIDEIQQVWDSYKFKNTSNLEIEELKQCDDVLKSLSEFITDIQPLWDKDE